MDSLEWRKKYEVLSISRLSLGSFGFSLEQIISLTDEDMQRIADTWNNQHFIAFEEDIKFLVGVPVAVGQKTTFRIGFVLSAANVTCY